MSVGQESPRRTRRARSKRAERAPRAAPGQTMRALWAKAQVASQSAQRLLDAGDTSGALNRAYYAAFGAARAALAAVRASLAQSRRHGTIFRRFEKHLVRERAFDATLGRGLLSRLGGARQAADYGLDPTEEVAARAAVADMRRFLAAVEALVTTWGIKQ